jgi:hypothetical protein
MVAPNIRGDDETIAQGDSGFHGRETTKRVRRMRRAYRCGPKRTTLKG